MWNNQFSFEVLSKLFIKVPVMRERHFPFRKDPHGTYALGFEFPASVECVKGFAFTLTLVLWFLVTQVSEEYIPSSTNIF